MKKRTLIKNVTLTVLCLLLVTPALIYGFPFFVGADVSYMVMSGSMSPTLRPGDLILVKHTILEAIEIGDIVTVRYGARFLTHRVFEKKIENGVYLFKTKGDANEDPDPVWWNASQIIGKTIFVIPVGYLYSPYGLTLAFLFPFALLVSTQMHHVCSQLKRRSKRELRMWRRKNHSVLDSTTALLILILLINGSWLIFPYFKLGSFSYFFSSEWMESTFTIGRWMIEVEINIDPDTLNLRSQGTWTTVYANITLCNGYKATDVDVNTILLDGEIPADWGDVQEEYIFMAKFNRTSVIEYLIGKGYKGGDLVTLKVTGQFTDGVNFQGSDIIKLED